MDGALVVGISQSGESPDLVAVVEEGRRQGCPTLAITNVAGSPLTPWPTTRSCCAPGRSAASRPPRRTPRNWLALAMLSTALAQNDEWRRELAEVRLVRGRGARGRSRRPSAAAARALKDAGHGVVIGRGFNFATAFEIALKAKELAYVAVEPYSVRRLPARADRAHRHRASPPSSSTWPAR